MRNKWGYVLFLLFPAVKIIEIIKSDNLIDAALQQSVNQITPNKTRSTGDQNSLFCSHFLCKNTKIPF
jgi:hypothetical protein